MTILDTNERRQRRLVAYFGVVTAFAIGLITLLVASQPRFWSDTDWIVCALLGSLLFLAETRPTFTMKFGDNGSVSPGWTFAYALVLFGMPIEALTVLMTANLVVDLRSRRPAHIMIFNVSQLGASLSAGALVLHLFGVTSITALDTIPLRWGLGIVLGACTILIMNGLLTAVAIALHTGFGFVMVYRSGLALSMTADGALMSLAPIFVIAVDYSLLLVPLLATTSYIVVRSARSSLQRAHDASHDPLTGLLNRREFDTRLSEAIQTLGRETDAVVLVMDFDRFKDINDSLGHAVGDSLLRKFGERLDDRLPPTASAARLGGDEFAVVIPGTDAASNIDLEIDNLHSALVEPFDIDGFPLSIGVSIGVSIAPLDGTNSEDLLAAADLAMYRAKQGHTGVDFYCGTSSGTTGTGRIDLLASLGDAIETGQLTAHFQPQVCLRTGVVDTVEALVRWAHPVHGQIQPKDFIGLAEQTDLIDDLTEHMLRRTMTDLLRIDRSDISLAVNVSPRSLHERTFANLVFDCLADTGFPAHRLELEITERAIARDTERMALTIARLRETGVRVAIDDFGTGYSSFGALRQIRCDRLKIDRQFTQRLLETDEDRLVVETIARLGHGLGLDVVIEGVESTGVVGLLDQLGCDFAQGFAIAPPVPLEQLRDQLVAMERPPIEVPA